MPSIKVPGENAEQQLREDLAPLNGFNEQQLSQFIDVVLNFLVNRYDLLLWKTIICVLPSFHFQLRPSSRCSCICPSEWGCKYTNIYICAADHNWVFVFADMAALRSTLRGVLQFFKLALRQSISPQNLRDDLVHFGTYELISSNRKLHNFLFFRDGRASCECRCWKVEGRIRWSVTKLDWPNVTRQRTARYRLAIWR